MVVVFVFLLYLYAKRYLGANPLLAPTSPSSRFLFVAASPLPQRGLPASVLRSLPVTVYAAAGAGSPRDKEKADALECAVCLSEVADGEKVRTLPKCGHGFHVECIDMWFHSHDTCPLCRVRELLGLLRAKEGEPAGHRHPDAARGPEHTAHELPAAGEPHARDRRRHAVPCLRQAAVAAPVAQQRQAGRGRHLLLQPEPARRRRW